MQPPLDHSEYAPDRPTALSRSSWIRYLLAGHFGLASYIIAGPLLPRILEGLEMPLVAGGFLFFVREIGALLMVVPAGILGARFGYRRMISLAFLVQGLALLAHLIAPTYSTLSSLFFLVGGAMGFTGPLITAQVTVGDGSRRARTLVLYFTATGMGVFTAPLFASALQIAGGGWRLGFATFGLVFVAFAVWEYLAVESLGRPAASKSVPAREEVGRLFATPGFGILFAAFVLYLGFHETIRTWIPSYVEYDLQAKPWLAGTSLGIYGAAMVFGRLLSAHLAERVGESRLLLIGFWAGSILYVGALLSNNVLVTVGIWVAAGLVAGAQLPLLLSYAAGRIPGDTAILYSVLFMAGGLHVAILPWIVGWLGDVWSLRVGMLLLACLYVAASVLFTVSEQRLFGRRDAPRVEAGCREIQEKVAESGG